MKSSSPKVLQAGLCLLLFFPAFFFGSVHEWASMVFAAVLFLILFLRPDFFLNLQLLPAHFLVICAAVFLWIMFQAFSFSVNPWLTRVELLKWFACAALFLPLRGLPRPVLETLLKMVIFTAVFQAIYGLVQTNLDYPWVLWRGQEKFEGFATGTFLNRNQLAGLLEMGMGVTAGYLLKSLYSRKKGEALLYTLIFALSFSTLVQTGSRMGLFSFLAASTAGCLVLFFRRTQGGALPLFIILFLVVYALAFLFGHQEFTSRFAGVEDPWGGRLQAWKDTLTMIRDNFWLGTGLGTYGWVFPHYQSASSLMGWTHAHQDYLELISGLGFPFFLIWTAGTFLFCFGVSRDTVLLKEDESFFVVWGIGLGLFAFLLHGFTDFNWAVPALSFLFFSLLSIAAALTGRSLKAGPLKTIPRFALRGLCLVLILCSGQKAWAGIHAYSAGRALAAKNYEKAADEARKSLKINAENPGLQFTLGKSLYEKGTQSGDTSNLLEAENIFKRLTGEHPEYARPWIYLGLISEDFQETKRNFSEGLKREPGSAWNLYKTSVRLLSRPELLTENEKKEARESLKRSFSLHYKDQVSPYLARSARELWRSARDFESILYAVPEDFLSYRTLLNTVESSQIGAYRDRVYDKFLKLSTAEYDAKCQEAETLLAVGQTSESFKLFRDAYWLRQELNRAKIGMLEAGGSYKKPIYGQEEGEKWMKEILLDENAGISKDRLEMISGSVKNSQDAFVKGMLDYRLGNWAEAIRYFSEESVSKAKARRWKADAYNRSGEKDKAVELLTPVLSEQNPDLRELLLLKRIDRGNAVKIEEKIKEVISLQSSYAFGSFENNKSELWVNLMPGKTELRVLMKLGAGQKEPVYVKLQVWDGEKTAFAGGAYVSSSNWKIYSFHFSGSGGGRLLTLQPASSGSRLELGALKIKTESYE